MRSYALYLESGPKRMKTMVHVPELLGCVAAGPTTEAALEATPQAIRSYLAFMVRHGEPVDLDEPFETHVAEHITEGVWLGNGSPYVVLSNDLDPIGGEEIEWLLRRFDGLTEELAAWAASRSDAELDAAPVERGRTACAILLHVAGPVGGYLSAAVGGAPGFSALYSAAERGDLPLPEVLERVAQMAAERVRATTDEQRAAVLYGGRDGSNVRTLRKALRRTLEHHWEHLAELSRRPGGPTL